MSDEKPEIQLFIKSSTIDREQKGSCPLCQQWFMAACILTEQGILSFHVTIVDAESPPKEFKDLSQSKIFPVVKGIRGLNKRGQDIGDKLADDHEGLEEFFESFGCPDLKRDGAVQKHFDDLYKFFNLFLQNPNDNGEKLTQKLEKLNAFLESEDERYVIKDFLTYGDCYLMPRLQHIKVGARHFNAFLQIGTDQARIRLFHHLEKLNSFLEGEDQIYVIKDVITYGDCYLMPRLHHIKVACREFAEFEIPEELFYVWRYLYETYKTDAFQKTCPTDQDIIKHYEKKAKAFKPKKGVPSLQKSSYSFDIPESILDTVENESGRQTVNANSPESYEALEMHESPAFDTEYEAPDNGYEEETTHEVDFEPEKAIYDAAQEAEITSFQVPNEDEPVSYEDPDKLGQATYDAQKESEYEAEPEENFNTYESAQKDQDVEANTYADTENDLANAGSDRSASPLSDQPASPTGSPSPSPDGGAEVDSEQTYDDLLEYNNFELPANNMLKNEMPANDQHEEDDQTEAPQDDSLYENVETRGGSEPSSKSVDFSIPNESREKSVELNGTNVHD